MGGGGKSQAKQATDVGLYSQGLSSQIASDLYGQTAPLRSSFMDEWNKLQQGQMPFGDTGYASMFSAARQPVEAQYGQAKQNILATNPTGGGLFENLANVETERANTLGNISAAYLNDFLNKAYGAAWQTPQMSISGLQGPMQMATNAASGVAQGAGTFGSACCFNFLEAEGEIYPTVRRYRDEHYPKGGYVSFGYIQTAIYLVPLMKRYRWIKKIVQLSMTRPLKAFSQWKYGENHWGFILWPLKAFWIDIWTILGWRVK